MSQCLTKCAAVLVFYGKIYHTHTYSQSSSNLAIYSRVWAGLSSSLSFDCTSVGINPGYGSAEHRAGEKIKQSPAECYLSKYQQLTFNTSILWLDSTPFVQRWIDWSLHYQLLQWYCMCGVRIKYILYTTFDNWSYYIAWLFYVMSESWVCKQTVYIHIQIHNWPEGVYLLSCRFILCKFRFMVYSWNLRYWCQRMQIGCPVVILCIIYIIYITVYLCSVCNK